MGISRLVLLWFLLKKSQNTVLATYHESNIKLKLRTFAVRYCAGLKKLPHLPDLSYISESKLA